MDRSAIWGKEVDEMNSNLLFVSSIISEKDNNQVKFDIAAADLYKVYINGESVFVGPSKAAKGYCILNEFSYSLVRGENTVAVLVTSYGVSSYYVLKQAPFFSISFTVDGKTYTENDFRAYDFKERVKNVQRFSFQRGFAEYYDQNGDIRDIIRKSPDYETPVPTIKRRTPEILNEIVPIAVLSEKVFGKTISQGQIYIDDGAQLWRDRSIFKVGNDFEGYKYEDLKECLTDTVCKFRYLESEIRSDLSDKEYVVYDFSRNISGLIGLSVSVKTECELYVIFDEIIKDKIVNPVRNHCCNVIKWSLKAGEYNLQAFEINTLRYLQVVCLKGKVQIKNTEVVLVENPSAYSVKLKTNDEIINKIFEAASNTLAQNSFDLLMDCPSRERAGWLNDLYYSYQSSAILSADDNVVIATLLNIILCEQMDTLPKGMVPMCYPSDHIDGQYIPQCALWYILCLMEYIDSPKLKPYSHRAEKQLSAILAYFEKYENEFGLLEDLGGWMFVGWSAASNKEFVEGVNYPTNMLYYKALIAVADHFGDDVVKAKAEKIKSGIISQSFNGDFFEDNRIRKNGILVKTGHVSEECQYYAFFSGVATVENYMRLYENLRDNFGVFRDKTINHPEIDKSNIINGLLMRLDLLNEQGEFDKVISEVKELFGVMAEKTSTLWENAGDYASFNHCVSSYAAVILLRTLLGVKEIKNNEIIFVNDYCKTRNCAAVFNIKNSKLYIKKSNDRITVNINEGCNL